MYNVVILAEQAMTAGDAEEVVALHEAIEESRHYYVVIPADDAQQRVGTALHSLGDDGEPAAASPGEAAGAVRSRRADGASPGDPVEASADAIRRLGVDASGEYGSDDPIDDLERVVADQQASEVIVMTRPHVVAELLHLDWTAKARRRIGVPILHLLEHEPLDAEAGNGQGISGM